MGEGTTTTSVVVEATVIEATITETTTTVTTGGADGPIVDMPPPDKSHESHESHAEPASDGADADAHRHVTVEAVVVEAQDAPEARTKTEPRIVVSDGPIRGEIVDDASSDAADR